MTKGAALVAYTCCATARKVIRAGFTPWKRWARVGASALERGTKWKEVLHRVLEREEALAVALRREALVIEQALRQAK
ncbi:hypothetical protein PUN4_310081 [Paraburkholderia unamae]|nr:hypothetical protein PUN4_310081 [Paraburkholderia unamae]